MPDAKKKNPLKTILCFLLLLAAHIVVTFVVGVISGFLTAMLAQWEFGKYLIFSTPAA